MVGIRKDILGGLPQQITEANDSLKGFLGTFQQFMGAMQQVTGQIGSTVQRLSNAPGQPTLFGPSGQLISGVAPGANNGNALALQGQTSQISNAINSLVQSNNQSNLALTRAISNLHAAIATLNTNLGNGQGGAGAPPAGPAPGGPQPAPVPRAPSLKDRLTAAGKVATGLATATAIGFAGYELYNQAALSQDKILQDAQLKRLQAKGALSEFAAKVNIESHDMTNSENILRYRGNMFLRPGERGEFFGGRDSIRRSYDAAAESTAIRIQNEKRQRDLDISRSIGKGIGGVLTGAATGALAGAAVGSLGLGVGAIPGAIIGGVGGALTSGIPSIGTATGSYLDSPYTTLSGGLTSGASGAFGQMRRGDQFSRLGGMAEQAARLGIQVDMNDLSRKYQDAEMQGKAPYAKMVIDQRLDLMRARQEGAVLVGEYAVGEKNYYRFTPNDLQREREKQVSEGIAEGNDSKAKRLGKDVRLFNFGKAVSEEGKSSFQKYMDENAPEGFGPSVPLLSMGKNALAALAYGISGPSGYPKESTAVKKAKALALGNYQSARSMGMVDEDFAQQRGTDLVNQYNPNRLMAAVRSVETGSEAGDYNAVNSIGMVGAYQISPRWWNKEAVKTMGMTVQQMRGNKEVQDKFYRNVLAPQFKREALELQKQNGLAAQLPTELVAGLEQLGAPSVKNFFETGNPNIYGNNASAYLRGLSKSSGLQIPQAFWDKLKEKGGPGAADFGAAGVAGTASFNPNDPMGAAASLEMSAGDFNRHRNQLTNLLGSRVSSDERQAAGLPFQGLVASEGATANMIRLGRSGLGSFDQLLGNLSQINQVSGGQDNTKRLEDTLSQAVAIGFDKSRTAQQFVHTSTQIAESLKVTNMANISSILGGATVLNSVNGVADERGLKSAAEGMQNYANFTGQRGGLSGTLTAVGAMRAGFRQGSGLNIVSGLNAPQMTDFIKTLESGGEITDRKLQALLDVSGAPKKQLADMLRGVRETTTRPFATQMELQLKNAQFGGVKFSNLPDFLRQASGSSRAMQAFGSKVQEMFGPMAVGPEGALAYVSETANLMGLSPNAQGLAALKAQSGNAVYRDAATQNRFNFIEQMTKNQVIYDSGQTNPGKIRSAYFDAIKQGVGLTRTVSVGGKDLPVTEQTYKEGGGQFRQAADDMFKNMSGFELAREVQERTSTESNAQRVVVENTYQIAEAMGLYMSSKNQALKDKGIP